jgi:hypothetical protein
VRLSSTEKCEFEAAKEHPVINVLSLRNVGSKGYDSCGPCGSVAGDVGPVSGSRSPCLYFGTISRLATGIPTDSNFTGREPLRPGEEDAINFNPKGSPSDGKLVKSLQRCCRSSQPPESLRSVIFLLRDPTSDRCFPKRRRPQQTPPRTAKLHGRLGVAGWCHV